MPLARGAKVDGPQGAHGVRVREAMAKAEGAEYALYWTYEEAHEHYRNTGYYSLDGELLSMAINMTATVVTLLDRCRSSGLPRFVRDIADVDAKLCALAPVRMAHGVKSLILLPQAHGSVLEIGTRADWEEPPEYEGVEEFTRSDRVTPRHVFEPTDVNMMKVTRNSAADYAIFWEYDEEADLLKLAKHYAIEGDCMARSSEVTFKPGVACVGTAWVDPSYRLVRDSTNLDIRTFLRADMINEYGVKSVAFTTFPNGVVETGTRTGWTALPNIDRFPTGERCHDFIVVALGRHGQFSREAMLKAFGAEYALYWTYEKEHERYRNTGYYSVHGELLATAINMTATVVTLFDRCRSSGLPSFVSNVANIKPAMCGLLPVRLEQGVQSLILLPQPNGGVLEIGTRQMWNEPPEYEGVDEFTRADQVTPRPPFNPTPDNMSKIITNSASDYAIFWAYDVRLDLLSLAKHHALDGDCMARSSEVTFKPGVACVGTAWVDPSYRLVRDSTNLDIRTFLRADMINEYGVKSVAFTTFPNGVVETGTRVGWTRAPNIDRDPRGKRCYDFILEERAKPALVSVTVDDDFLYAALLKCPSAEYALFWQYDDEQQHYRNTAYFSVDDVILSSAKGMTATVAGLLDRARTSGLPRFLRNVGDVSTKDCSLVSLRKQYDVLSAVLIPYVEGILELGTRRLWEEPPEIEGVHNFTRSDKLIARPPFEPTAANLRKVMANVAGDYAIFWTLDEEDKLIKLHSHEAYDGDCMARSSEVTFKPGVACIGTAWVDPTYCLVRDSTKLDIRVFLRADMINEYGIKSIGFCRFPNGVLEYGTTDGWEEAPSIDMDQHKRRCYDFLLTTARPAFNPSQEQLLKVMRYTDAAYAIFWLYAADINELRCAAYHSYDGSVMEMSRTFTFMPGVGCIGSAWVDPKYTFIKDATKLDIRNILRANLILNDGIKSICFTKFANGVVEYGTTKGWKVAPTIDTDEYGRRVKDFLAQ